MPATWRGGRGEERSRAERHADGGGEREQDGGRAEVWLTHLTSAFNARTCGSLTVRETTSDGEDGL